MKRRMKHRNDAASCLIPLNRLKKSPRNVRQVPHSKAHIVALANSIHAYAQIHSLVVETERDAEGHETGDYLVTVGEGRRLAQLLRVKRRQINADEPIRCTIDDMHDAPALSLAENEVREPMHPADQFVAFQQLVESGLPLEDVAARFSVAPLVVKRRLKLANVAPEFIKLYRDGEVSLEQLMALAISDDHAQQRQVWKDLPVHHRAADALRAALTREEVPLSDPVAHFVTLKAYEKAGGTVRRDLFAEEDDVYLADRALLERLAQEKLDKQAAKLKEQGVAWIEATPRMDYSTRATYGHVRTVRREPNEQEAQALAVARDRLAEIDQQREQAGEDEEKQAELDDAADAVQEAIDTLADALTVPDPQQQALAGAIVTIGRDGKLEIDRDRLKPEDVDRAMRSLKQTPAEGGPRTHSASMTRRLTAHRTLALQASLAQQPQVALLALTHRLVLREFYSGRSGSSAIQVRVEPVLLRQELPDVERTKAHGALQAQREKLRAQLPEADVLFQWLSAQSADVRLELLAFCVSQSVNGVQSDDRPSAFNELAAATQLDMRNWWTPTAEGYFSAIPKADILKAVKEVIPEVVAPLALLKKTNLAKAAEEKLTGTGWLPSLLRANAV